MAHPNEHQAKAQIKVMYQHLEILRKAMIPSGDNTTDQSSASFLDAIADNLAELEKQL